MTHRTTRTYAVLEISPKAFAEIETKLRRASYQHAIHADDEYGTVLDMDGIALGITLGTEATPAERADLIKHQLKSYGLSAVELDQFFQRWPVAR